MANAGFVKHTNRQMLSSELSFNFFILKINSPRNIYWIMSETTEAIGILRRVNGCLQ
jgi:hypothetical protein